MFATPHTNDGCTAASLLAGALAGDREAFAELVMPCRPKLLRLAFRLTGNEADAEDACQEALLKAFLKLQQFSGTPRGTRDELQAWLKGIVKNAAIDIMRRNRGHKTVSLDDTAGDSDGTLGGQIPSKADNPEEVLARRQSLTLFAAAITELPRHLRQVCLLSDVLQYSTQEMAAGLGISPMAVRTRLFRARGRLRMTLQPMFADGPF